MPLGRRKKVAPVSQTPVEALQPGQDKTPDQPSIKSPGYRGKNARRVHPINGVVSPPVSVGVFQLFYSPELKRKRKLPRGYSSLMRQALASPAFRPESPATGFPFNTPDNPLNTTTPFSPSVLLSCKEAVDDKGIIVSMRGHPRTLNQEKIQEICETFIKLLTHNEMTYREAAGFESAELNWLRSIFLTKRDLNIQVLHAVVLNKGLGRENNKRLLRHKNSADSLFHDYSQAHLGKDGATILLQLQVEGQFFTIELDFDPLGKEIILARSKMLAVRNRTVEISSPKINTIHAVFRNENALDFFEAVFTTMSYCSQDIYNLLIQIQYFSRHVDNFYEISEGLASRLLQEKVGPDFSDAHPDIFERLRIGLDMGATRQFIEIGNYLFRGDYYKDHQRFFLRALCGREVGFNFEALTFLGVMKALWCLYVDLRGIVGLPQITRCVGVSSIKLKLLKESIRYLGEISGIPSVTYWPEVSQNMPAAPKRYPASCRFLSLLASAEPYLRAPVSPDSPPAYHPRFRS